MAELNTGPQTPGISTIPRRDDLEIHASTKDSSAQEGTINTANSSGMDTGILPFGGTISKIPTSNDSEIRANTKDLSFPDGIINTSNSSDARMDTGTEYTDIFPSGTNSTHDSSVSRMEADAALLLMGTTSNCICSDTHVEKCTKDSSIITTGTADIHDASGMTTEEEITNLNAFESSNIRRSSGTDLFRSTSNDASYSPVLGGTAVTSEPKNDSGVADEPELVYSSPVTTDSSDSTGFPSTTGSPAEGGATNTHESDGHRPGATKRKRKLIFHVDVRNTIIVADSVTNIKVEQALNSFLTSVAWGRIDNGEWQWVHDTPLLSAPASDTVTYYKYVERNLVKTPSDRFHLRLITGDFTSEKIGLKFRPYFEEHLVLLRWPHPPNPQHDLLTLKDESTIYEFQTTGRNLENNLNDEFDCDFKKKLMDEVNNRNINNKNNYTQISQESMDYGNINDMTQSTNTNINNNMITYHYILPSFLNLIFNLHCSGRDFAIVLRTYGIDGPNVLASLQHTVNGFHPDFNKSIQMNVLADIGTIKRDEKEIFCNIDGQIYKDESSIYNYFSGLNHQIIGLVDDFEFWQNNNYHHSTGKPMWIDLNDPNVQHIFLDDNIRVKETDGIVDVRLKTNTSTKKSFKFDTEDKLNTNIPISMPCNTTTPNISHQSNLFSSINNDFKSNDVTTIDTKPDISIFKENVLTISDTKILSKASQPTDPISIEQIMIDTKSNTISQMFLSKDTDITIPCNESLILYDKFINVANPFISNRNKSFSQIQGLKSEDSDIYDKFINISNPFVAKKRSHSVLGTTSEINSINRSNIYDQFVNISNPFVIKASKNSLPDQSLNTELNSLPIDKKFKKNFNKFTNSQVSTVNIEKPLNFSNEFNKSLTSEVSITCLFNSHYIDHDDCFDILENDICSLNNNKNNCIDNNLPRKIIPCNKFTKNTANDSLTNHIYSHAICDNDRKDNYLSNNKTSQNEHESESIDYLINNCKSKEQYSKIINANTYANHSRNNASFYQSLSTEELSIFEGSCLLQADLLASISNQNYFIDEIEKCEQRYDLILEQFTKGTLKI